MGHEKIFYSGQVACPFLKEGKMSEYIASLAFEGNMRGYPFLVYRIDIDQNKKNGASWLCGYLLTDAHAENCSAVTFDDVLDSNLAIAEENLPEYARGKHALGVDTAGMLFTNFSHVCDVMSKLHQVADFLEAGRGN